MDCRNEICHHRFYHPQGPTGKGTLSTLVNNPQTITTNVVDTTALRKRLFLRKHNSAIIMIHDVRMKPNLGAQAIRNITSPVTSTSLKRSPASLKNFSSFLFWRRAGANTNMPQIHKAMPISVGKSPGPAYEPGTFPNCMLLCTMSAPPTVHPVPITVSLASNATTLPHK